MGALLLDDGVAAQLAQARCDQARCAALAVGSRRPREGGQLVDRRTPRPSFKARCICLLVR